MDIVPVRYQNMMAIDNRNQQFAITNFQDTTLRLNSPLLMPLPGICLDLEQH